MVSELGIWARGKDQTSIVFLIFVLTIAIDWDQLDVSIFGRCRQLLIWLAS